MKNVTITVDPQGEVKVEVNGVVGRGCDALARPFEEGLGAVKKRVNKPEYGQTVKANNQQKAGA